MAAPDYVPNDTAVADRHYVSPPRRPQPWVADRPAELTNGQPTGAGLGIPGPDQGYALRLARRFEDLIRAAPTQWHLVQPNWPSDREFLAALRREG